jgi:hypothetical protein
MNGSLTAELKKPTNLWLTGSQCPKNAWLKINEQDTNSRLSTNSEQYERKNNDGTLEKMGRTFLMFGQNPNVQSYRN